LPASDSFGFYGHSDPNDPTYFVPHCDKHTG